jgi:hypothetical protein
MCVGACVGQGLLGDWIMAGSCLIVMPNGRYIYIYIYVCMCVCKEPRIPIVSLCMLLNGCK